MRSRGWPARSGPSRLRLIGGLRRTVLIAALVGLIAASPAPAANPRPQTIPALREWVGGSGSFSLRLDSRIVVNRRHRARLRSEARILAAELHLPVTSTCRRRRCRVRAGDIYLSLGSDDRELGREGYRLRVGRAVRISARTDAGAFYGTRTVLQLLKQGRVPAGTARDWPRYPERGLMVDCGRKYFTPGWFHRRIKELAYLKLNYLHLHLSDDQGFRIQSDRHPEIVSLAHLSKAEVREIVALAGRHHITVVPEIDMPGHMDAALKAHPELQLTDALGRRAPDRLDVTNPAALRFARDLIEEYLPLFPGPYWHGGADEYMAAAEYPLFPKLESHARARYGSQANAKDAVHGFVNWVNGIVRGHGKTLRVWNDDLKGGRAVTVAREAVVEWWTDVSPLSDADTPEPSELLAQGHAIMNAGWFPTYYVAAAYGEGPLDPDMKTAYERWAVHDFYGPFNPPFTFPPERVSAGEPRNLGSKLNVWNDDPNLRTQDEIARGIHPRLQVIAQKTWDSPRLVAGYEAFLRIAARIGHAPGELVERRACLARRSPIGPRNIGRIRLGRTRRQLVRRTGLTPARRTRRSYRWCVRASSGQVAAVFSPHGRARLVASTARLHRMRRVGRGARRSTLLRRFPRALRLSAGVYRAGPGSRRLFAVRGGRVRFVAVADRRLITRGSALRRYLRRAGL